MRRWIAMLLCVLLVFSVPVTALAEEDTETDTETDTTTTVVDEDPPEDDPVDITTDKPTTTTTTKEIVRMKTAMTVSYESGTVTVRVVDTNGQPVRQAPVAVAVDGTPYSLTTNSSGTATISVSGTPSEIRASMSEFQGAVFYYEGSSASVVLSSPTSVASRETTTTTGSSAAATTTSIPSQTATVSRNANTTSATAGRTTSPDPSRTLTTTDPAEGDVTEIVTVTGTTTKAEKEADTVSGGFPRGLALGLMIFGVALLVTAGLLVYLFLIRKPRDPDEDEEVIDGSFEDAEETFAETEDAEEVDESDPDEMEIPSKAQRSAASCRPAEKPPVRKGDEVSLEDLFRK